MKDKFFNIITSDYDRIEMDKFVIKRKDKQAILTCRHRQYRNLKLGREVEVIELLFSALESINLHFRIYITAPSTP